MHNEYLFKQAKYRTGQYMNWDDYRYFLSVSRTGRLSKAGEQLGVDHATVGRRIKALENNLKVILFDRSPQGYKLTEAGSHLVEIAETMESNAVKAQAEIAEQDNVLTGSVRIGTSEGIASYILTDIAISLCEQHPKLEIQIVALPQTFSLSKREADIAIAVSAPASGRLKYRKISDYTLHLYGTADYLNQHSKIEKIEDLRKLRGIAYVPDLIYDKQLDYIPLLGSQIKPHLTSTSIHVQMEATLKGGGVCILHDFMTHGHPELKRVLADKISFTRSFYYVVHEDYAKLERIKVVSEALINGIRQRLAEPNQSTRRI